MTDQRVPLTRAFSSESSASSNIHLMQHAMDIDSASDDPAASTPPTSVSDSRSTHSSSNKAEEIMVEQQVQQEESNGRRSKRARMSVNYNLKQLFDATVPESSSQARRNASGLSGRTLVNNEDDVDDAEEEEFEARPELLAGQLNVSPSKASTSLKGKAIVKKPTRRPSMKERARNVASVLGKRTRDMVEAGKKKLGMVAEEREEEDSPRKIKMLRELDMGARGVLDELDLEAEFEPPRPTKRAKTTKPPLQEMAQMKTGGPMQKTSDGTRVKKWQEHGLYAGQELDFDPDKPASKKRLQKKRPLSTTSENLVDGEEAERQPKVARLGFNLPMFGYLGEDKTRSFRIPYDVFAPSQKKPEGEKPKDWHKLNRNRLVGDAKDLWAREEKLAESVCICRPPSPGEQGCDEDCLNRIMLYECDDKNCSLDAHQCSNRPFAELAARTKKGGLYDVGVEVVKTDQRGHGIRASRSFRPGQIIMEYTGEIISEAECQRRMQEDYKGKNNYYLMEMEKNLVLDGTKGSMARFINHSCEPNCEVRMMKVNGIPRLGVYAGDSGIMTGEELSYDYNFDNFGETRQLCYCGATNCRGYLGKRLNANEMKKLAKEDAERLKREAEAAAKAARKAQFQKQQKDDRGSGWRGWLAVDDPETKARLKAEKEKRLEAEKNSSRAQRLARRREGGVAKEDSVKPESPARKKAQPQRRKTASITEVSRQVTNESEVIEDESDEDIKLHVAKQLSRPKHRRTTSTGSKFTEDLTMGDRPASRSPARPSSRNSVTKKTTFSVMRTSTEVHRETISKDGAAADHSSCPSFADKISRSVGSSGVKILSDDDAMELIEESKLVPKRTNSVRDKVKQAARSASKTFRQSTLNFSKLS